MSNKGQLQKRINAPHHYWSLEDGNTLIGTLEWDQAADEIQIIDLKIEAPFRQKGYASQLLDELIKHSKENGFSKIFLEVRKSNAPAINLYLKYHFKKFGERKEYYNNPKEDAFLLEKIIQL